MKKKRLILPAAIAALLLALSTLLGVMFGVRGTNRAYAAGEYDFEFTYYSVTYDVRADRTMDVTLDLGVHYLGWSSTGIMYDIPVNSGDRVRNLSAVELSGKDGSENRLDYKVKHETTNFITVDMGDYSNKRGETHYYRVKYEYAITKPAKNEKNAIFLNAIGFGSDGAMEDVNITLNLPDGLIKDGIISFVGFSGSDKGQKDNFTVSGNTVTMHIDELSARQGVTFELPFEEGVLSVKPDLTPYWIIIAACVILAVLFAVKFLAFNRDGLTPIVNVEAPDDMDPLVMGKLIDNKVDKSDVTSLIYYWANKGYIKIDLTNEKNPELIRLYKHLPPNSPGYQNMMYDRLFKSGDCVKVNSLTNTFYGTVDRVTKTVNAENGKLYSGKSMGVAVLFALFGGLFMGLTPLIITLTTISSKLLFIIPIFMIVPSFIVFALTQSVRYNRLKHKKGKQALMYAGIALLGALFTAIYVWLVPSYIVEVAPKILIGALGFAIIMLAACIISRTEQYVKKLNKIVGFRDFILYTEKDKLETMLESNPEFYYQVLPYAIVLGVSDIWENKFAALTVTPPSWCTSSYSDTVFNFIVFNSVMRNVNRNITSAFVSRPNSGSASGGGSHGGSFGGFSGGGHGGGGFRGR